MRFLSQTMVALVSLLPITVHSGFSAGGGLEFVPIPAGIYEPILRGKRDPARVFVEPFLLAAHAVTNAEFLDFVRANPKWRRSAIAPIFADSGYLSRWQSDLEPGAAAPPGSPVVEVSWFAARAYVKWHGARLPTVAEWELAAGTGFERLDGNNDPAMRQRIAEWLATPAPAILPDAAAGSPDYHGVHNLHGLVWEWAEDFNSAMVNGESRADGGFDRDLFCGAGAAGAKDSTDYPAFMRTAFRSSLRANYCVANLGFRCAKSLPKKSP